MSVIEIEALQYCIVSPNIHFIIINITLYNPPSYTPYINLKKTLINVLVE